MDRIDLLLLLRIFPMRPETSAAQRRDRDLRSANRRLVNPGFESRARSAAERQGFALR